MSRPYLLLDIDGVILPHGSVAWPGGVQVPTLWREDYASYRWFDQFFGNKAHAHIPDRIVEAIHELDRHYEIVWASLRGEQALQIGQVIDLPEYGHLDFQYKAGDSYIPSLAKAGTILEWASGGEPFAWVDDAAIPPQWLEEHPFGHQEVHLELVEDPNHGLSQKNLNRLIRFAGRLS